MSRNSDSSGSSTGDSTQPVASTSRRPPSDTPSLSSGNTSSGTSSSSGSNGHSVDSNGQVPIDLRGGRGEEDGRDQRQQERYERMLRARTLLAQQQYEEAFALITQLAEGNNALRSSLGMRGTDVASMIEGTPLEPLYRSWLASRPASAEGSTSSAQTSSAPSNEASSSSSTNASGSSAAPSPLPQDNSSLNEKTR